MAECPRALWMMEAPDHSGVAFAARHLAVGMRRTGCRLAIFVLQDGEIAGDFEQAGCLLWVFPRAGTRLLGNSAMKEAKELGVDIVHILTPALVSRGYRLAKQLDVPLVVTANRLDVDELSLLKNFPGQGVVAVSEAIRERLANVAGLPSRFITVIPNGLDLASLPKPDFSRHATSIPGRLPVVGTLGHLAERKGQRIFLQAVRDLLNRGLDAEFVVLGDGPDRTALRHLAEELDVAKRVTFTPQTVSGQLTQLDVLVEPSLQEGLGLSVMQAMAMGVPVVGTGVGGLYSLIEDGVTGLMVPANDSVALADAIWRILHNKEERQDMARAARELIENEFSSDHVAERLEDYYSDTVAEFSGWKRGNTGLNARG